MQNDVTPDAQLNLQIVKRLAEELSLNDGELELVRQLLTSGEDDDFGWVEFADVVIARDNGGAHGTD